jgi:hypothetical protein
MLCGGSEDLIMLYFFIFFNIMCHVFPVRCRSSGNIHFTRPVSPYVQPSYGPVFLFGPLCVAILSLFFWIVYGSFYNLLHHRFALLLMDV